MRKNILVLWVALALILTSACGESKRRREAEQPPAPVSAEPTAVTLRPTGTPVPRAATRAPARATSTRPPPVATATPVPTAPGHRAITFNDYVSEQTNYVDVLCIVVNFEGKPDRVFDLRKYWERIFGLDDPIRQLNAYYHENFYGQLQLRPYTTLQMGEKGYVEVTLPGSPKDWSFGWLVNYESPDVPSLDAGMVQKLTLEIMTRVVQKYPGLNFQDKFVLVVMNAIGAEYGRGAAGVVPADGPDNATDLFIGDVAAADRSKFTDEAFFRVADNDKLVGLVAPQGYTFTDYFRDRETESAQDQFILGLAMFGTDGPLSCASHDILHGLRRKSAYADPPEGRSRAVHCLYNLVQQSKWLVGTAEHGRTDRGVTVSPYIGWWDPVADHLHPDEREFFNSHPTGSCAFTKLRMGMIPDRCLAVADKDDVTVKLSPLGIPTLPARGSEAESLAVKVPLLPLNPAAAHLYLLLEYRRRVGSETGETHPDNFTISPDDVLGDKRFDPGYNTADPAASVYVNPPTVFVPDEGVLVYLVNDKVPEVPAAPYTEWYNFNLALLNPAGNDQRDNLNEAALDAGETMTVDFSTLVPGKAVPVKIIVSVTARNNNYATVHIVREYVR